MSELRTYQFPVRVEASLAFGLSLSRLVAVGVAGVVFIVMMTVGGTGVVSSGVVLLVVLAAGTFLRVGGRYAIDWLPVWAGFGWAAATRNNEFYSSPELTGPLPPETLDLPGELFGLELHEFTPDTAVEVGGERRYGTVRDTFRGRLVAIVEVSGEDFLFLDPEDEQARITAWGATLDHLAQSLPEVVRLQVVHTVGPASAEVLSEDHDRHGGRGSEVTASSYRQVLARSGAAAQEHRCLIAIALEARQARRAVRQAGGGLPGAGRVLMERAVAVEDALQAAGLSVHGWLSATQIARLLRTAFDPASHHRPGDEPALSGAEDTGGPAGEALPVAVATAGPTALVDQWSALRHDGGWSTTWQVIRPPSRPVTGDFLQHLLIGVAARRRMSLLYVPTSMHVAERRAQTDQVSTEAEEAVRARWGFASSARHRRAHADAASREAELVEGRAVYRVVWLITVTADDPAALDAADGQVEAAARRCGVELRRLAGTQRQAFGFTLPLCRGAR